MSSENISPEQKKQVLIERLSDFDSALVAFSGGVDSSFLLAMASRYIKKIGAVSVRSEFVTDEEFSHAEDAALKAGIPFYPLSFDVFSDAAVISNPPDRCYYCKKKIFTDIKALAERENFEAVLEGTNADDLYDIRPGMKAVKEAGALSPLLEAGLTKDEIRLLSKEEGLDGWDRPSNSCLATRIPSGDRITLQDLTKAAGAERAIRKIGIDNVRVRCERDNARIEVDKEDIPLLLNSEISEVIVRGLKSLGFKRISVDLEGYKNPVDFQENNESEKGTALPSSD